MKKFVAALLVLTMAVALAATAGLVYAGLRLPA